MFYEKEARYYILSMLTSKFKCNGNMYILLYCEDLSVSFKLYLFLLLSNEKISKKKIIYNCNFNLWLNLNLICRRIRTSILLLRHSFFFYDNLVIHPDLDFSFY